MSSIPPNCGGVNKTEGSNTIMSTLFASKFWSNKLIDVDIIHYIGYQLKVAH